MRILSGITPSSTHGLHIGNYFGMVKRAVEMQSVGECFFFVANLHSLNTVFNPKEVEDNTLNIFIEYLAFGIDPQQCTFFVESDIPEIPYLQTILNNVVTVSELQRMHGYKDKLSQEVDPGRISAGLFEYPVLMAADILLFDIDLVPVGEDQVQHVEIAREMAKTFNTRYGSLLKIPEVKIHKATARVLGTDGQRKMSKSLGNDISIFADEKTIHKQIMGITTDPSRIRPTDSGDPQKNVCFSYFRLLGVSTSEIEEMEDRYRSGTIGDVEIKKKLYEVFMEYFSTIRDRKKELIQDIHGVHDLRVTGANNARKIALPNLNKILKSCGVL